MNDQRCAFLTMDHTDGWCIDADLAIAPLQARNWRVEQVPWRSPNVDWTRFDAVYIGTPWDYPKDLGQFIGVLERIDESGAILVNDLELVRWNVHKTYLRDLQSRGAAIVPSHWREHLQKGQLTRFFDELAADRIIVKPVVGSNATDTWLLTRESARTHEETLLRTFDERAFVVQPFIDNIQTEGEYSLFYFGNQYSHAIQKIPGAGDFRVQEEHGARILAATPDPAVIDCADRILMFVKPAPAYARCDLVRGPDGRFLLMELELIEPSMYLRMDTNAADRFAAAFHRYVALRRTTS